MRSPSASAAASSPRRQAASCQVRSLRGGSAQDNARLSTRFPQLLWKSLARGMPQGCGNRKLRRLYQSFAPPTKTARDARTKSDLRKLSSSEELTAEEA